MPTGIYKRTDNHREALRQAYRAENYSINSKKTQFKKGLIPWNKGIKLNEEQKGKLDLTGLLWNKNKYLPEKHRKKISLSHQGKHYSPNTEFKKGDNHWNWKGGISNLRTQIYGTFKFRQWRSDIFTRDNFVCQKCFKKGNLSAHHIKRFSIILKENNIQTVDDALKCDELWNINNGQSLCKDCHKKTKNYAGRKET